MSELTLDDAIKHCLEVARENDSQATEYNEHDEWEFVNKCNCEQCAADHRQLAEWLMELKDLKAEQNDQYVFIHELMDELKEAKRLLKTVVEFRNSGYCTKNCSECVASPCDYIDWFKNMYDNEIEKLIGDELSGV